MNHVTANNCTRRSSKPISVNIHVRVDGDGPRARQFRKRLLGVSS